MCKLEEELEELQTIMKGRPEKEQPSWEPSWAKHVGNLKFLKGMVRSCNSDKKDREEALKKRVEELTSQITALTTN